jgi:predicted dehydrogenase
MSRKTKVGIIGCGKISDQYFKGCASFDHMEVVSCADLDNARAAAKAAEHYLPRSATVEELLADPEIEIVVNLTVPKAHTAVNLDILNAGKNVFCEKPFSVSREEGAPVLALAKEKGLLVGSAPDTFLGAAHRTCRKILDDGLIGQPVAATAFMASHGPENWHPNPDFFYQPGAGPMFDMGPYYLTALVNLLGPMWRVSGSTKITYPERVIGSEPLRGTRIKVNTTTHLTGTIDFLGGAIATVLMSFDVWKSRLPWIEIYGTEGTLRVPDPNYPDGEVFVSERDGDWESVPMAYSTIAGRGAGVADMASTLQTGRAFRASGEIALHVVDAMEAFDESSDIGQRIELTTTCERPPLF